MCLPGPSIGDNCIELLYCIPYKRWLLAVACSFVPALLYFALLLVQYLSWCWPTSYRLFINRIVLCNLALVLGGAGAR